jgi:hypothetical protein
MRHQSAIHGGGEDVSDTARLLTKHMRVDPQGDRRVGLAETSRDRLSLASWRGWNCSSPQPVAPVSKSPTASNARLRRPVVTCRTTPAARNRSTASLVAWKVLPM